MARGEVTYSHEAVFVLVFGICFLEEVLEAVGSWAWSSRFSAGGTSVQAAGSSCAKI